MPTENLMKVRVTEVVKDTEDCVKVTIMPDLDILEQFHFISGQYLTFEREIQGEKIRRSYSICSAPFENKLTVAIKEVPQGKFSTFANHELQSGDYLNCLLPDGKFVIKNLHAQNYLFIASGSGITPIVSMIKHLLYTNANANVTLIFGNRNLSSVMFFEELNDLKNTNINRFSIYHIFSKQHTDNDLSFGRINKEKCRFIIEKDLQLNALEGIYACGPSEMIMDLKMFFETEMKFESTKYHFELFNTDNLKVQSTYLDNLNANTELKNKQSQVIVEVDGVRTSMNMTYGGETILDAALKAGSDLPYACKGGVCCTCRAKLLKGEVDMAINYSLEPEEVANGFILTCQAHPKTEEVIVSFDFK